MTFAFFACFVLALDIKTGSVNHIGTHCIWVLSSLRWASFYHIFPFPTLDSVDVFSSSKMPQVILISGLILILTGFSSPSPIGKGNEVFLVEKELQVQNSHMIGKRNAMTTDDDCPDCSIAPATGGLYPIHMTATVRM